MLGKGKIMTRCIALKDVVMGRVHWPVYVHEKGQVTVEMGRKDRLFHLRLKGKKKSADKKACYSPLPII